MSRSRPSLRKRQSYQPFFRILTRHAIRKSKQLRKLIPVQTKYERLKEEFELLTAHSSDTIYRLRYDSMAYDYVSPTVTRLLGYTPQEMKQINFRSLILETRMIDDKFHTIHSFTEFEEARRRGHANKWEADYLMRTKDGRKIWVSDISQPWHDSDGKLIGSIGSLRDITQRVMAEERTREMAHNFTHKDALTGLVNRNTLLKHLDHEFKVFRQNHQHFSLLLISLDHFEHINEVHGYEVGDMVLTETASLLRSTLRKTDVAARLEGDQFAIFLPNTQENEAYWVSERIAQAIHKFSFAKDLLTQGIHGTVSISITSTECPYALSTSQLMQQADMRLYVAQSTGIGHVYADNAAIVH